MNDEKIVDTAGKLIVYNTVNYEIQTTAKTVILVGAAVLTTAAVVNMFVGDKNNNNNNAAFKVTGGIN